MQPNIWKRAKDGNYYYPIIEADWVVKGDLKMNYLKSKQSALSGLHGVLTMRCNFPFANAR